MDGLDFGLGFGLIMILISLIGSMTLMLVIFLIFHFLALKTQHGVGRVLRWDRKVAGSTVTAISYYLAFAFWVALLLGWLQVYMYTSLPMFLFSLELPDLEKLNYIMVSFTFWRHRSDLSAFQIKPLRNIVALILFFALIVSLLQITASVYRIVPQVQYLIHATRPLIVLMLVVMVVRRSRLAPDRLV